MDVAGAKGAALQITELVVEETMSADEMIACLGSCRARGEIGEHRRGAEPSPLRDLRVSADEPALA